MELSEHETASQRRYEDLKRHVTASHEHHKGQEMHQVPEVNYFAGSGMGGAGAGLGAGLGGGLLGGILGGALLGNRGILGGERGLVGEGCVTPSQLTAALAGVQDTQMNTAVLQGLGDIKAAVPLAESQVQLALAQAQGQIANQIGQQSLAIAQGFGNTSQQISQATAAIVAVGESVRDTVNANGTANLIATKDASAANLAAVATSTNLILSALKDNEITNLSRQLTVSELRNTEDRAEARSRAVEVNVAQTVTQNQNNLQAQAQSQSQFQLLAQLAAGFNNLTNDVQAIRQGSVVFNSGTMAASGNQSAQNTRVA